ncbi:MAG TPA: hypothetical protein VFO11_00590, partial [Candidatus Polarisedimenticolaceae bacterium]|nr:hypothetical protein [Candidatus Polarisedimenticolaceae bacterium]
MRVGIAMLSLALLAAKEEPRSTPPLDLGVTEETGTALGQIDVTLTGKPEALAQVGAGSFELWVNSQKVETFLADGICPAAGPPPPGAEVASEDTPQELPHRPATWILYFDQPHLTSQGRARAIRMARDSLPGIFQPGDRAAVISNAASLKTEQAMTDDLQEVLAALDRLEKDQTQFDIYASGEDGRVSCFDRSEQDFCPLPPTTIGEAQVLAYRYAEEELWRTQRDLFRLALTIGRLSDVDQPKGVFYFSDTTRRRAGDHYTSFFARGQGARWDQLHLPVGGELSFDRVLKNAAALGIRFYTIEAQPLQTSSTRVREAQQTLQAMAAETGGRAFINGVTAKRIVSGLREDRGCLWLLSFDPEGLPKDAALPVAVKVHVPGVKVQARGQTVIQSARSRLSNRLLAHFVVETGSEASPLRAAFVPLAWKDGKYTALLQVVAPPTSLAGATWDLGASVVATERIAAETSARTKVGGSNVPVALERVVELKPGPFEVVAVAREVTTEKVFSARTVGAWPDPDDALAGIVQPVVLQPGPGAFTRDGQIRKTGSLVHGKDDPLDA